MVEAQPTFRRPRFPWAQFVFCLACLGMAAYTWMRYSYCWQHTPADLGFTQSETMEGAYVRVRGRPAIVGNAEDYKGVYAWEVRLSDGLHSVNVLTPGSNTPVFATETVEYAGRVVRSKWAEVVGPKYLVDGRASRFHAASVAGLVVGMMGVLIFWLHLRQWLGGKRLRDAGTS